MKRSNGLRRVGVPLAKTPARRSPRRDTGPSALTVGLVLERDGNRCVRCGTSATGYRGVDWSIQHRRPRGMGGTSRPDTNQPQNLIVLCGNGTAGCHGWVESHRESALECGWLVLQSADPAREPVLVRGHRWVWLTADGTTAIEPPEVA